MRSGEGGAERVAPRRPATAGSGGYGARSDRVHAGAAEVRDRSTGPDNPAPADGAAIRGHERSEPPATVNAGRAGRVLTGTAPSPASPHPAEPRPEDRVPDPTSVQPQPAPTVAGLATPEEVRAAYGLHGAEIYRFALRGLGDPGAAQDVTQETFLKAWRFSDRYDAALSSLRGWLFGIARTTMIDHVRAERVRPWQGALLDPTTLGTDAGEDTPTQDATERVLEQWLVEEALRRISDQHREAIVQTHLLERPYAEVAAELGVPVGTLRSRVFYGLKALRVAMDEMGVTR